MIQTFTSKRSGSSIVLFFVFDCRRFPLTFTTRHGSTKMHPREFHGSRHSPACLLCKNNPTYFWLLRSIIPASRLTPVFSLLIQWPGGSHIFWFKWKHSTVGRSDPQAKSTLHGWGRNWNFCKWTVKSDDERANPTPTPWPPVPWILALGETAPQNGFWLKAYPASC